MSSSNLSLTTLRYDEYPSDLTKTLSTSVNAIAIRGSKIACLFKDLLLYIMDWLEDGDLVKFLLTQKRYAILL